MDNNDPNAVFVSIHFDSRPGGAAGFQTLVLKTGKGEAVRAQTGALASAIHKTCVTRLGMEDGGVKAAHFTVLGGLLIPAILVEGGNLMSAADAILIADPNHRDKLADAIAEGLETYRVATGRKPKYPAPEDAKPK